MKFAAPLLLLLVALVRAEVFTGSNTFEDARVDGTQVVLDRVDSTTGFVVDSSRVELAGRHGDTVCPAGVRASGTLIGENMTATVYSEAATLDVVVENTRTGERETFTVAAPTLDGAELTWPTTTTPAAADAAACVDDDGELCVAFGDLVNTSFVDTSCVPERTVWTVTSLACNNVVVPPKATSAVLLEKSLRNNIAKLERLRERLVNLTTSWVSWDEYRTSEVMASHTAAMAESSYAFGTQCLADLTHATGEFGDAMQHDPALFPRQRSGGAASSISVRDVNDPLAALSSLSWDNLDTAGPLSTEQHAQAVFYHSSNRAVVVAYAVAHDSPMAGVWIDVWRVSTSSKRAVVDAGWTRVARHHMYDSSGREDSAHQEYLSIDVIDTDTVRVLARGYYDQACSSEAICNGWSVADGGIFAASSPQCAVSLCRPSVKGTLSTSPSYHYVNSATVDIHTDDDGATITPSAFSVPVTMTELKTHTPPIMSRAHPWRVNAYSGTTVHEQVVFRSSDECASSTPGKPATLPIMVWAQEGARGRWLPEFGEQRAAVDVFSSSEYAHSSVWDSAKDIGSFANGSAGDTGVLFVVADDDDEHSALAILPDSSVGVLAEVVEDIDGTRPAVAAQRMHALVATVVDGRTIRASLYSADGVLRSWHTVRVAGHARPQRLAVEATGYGWALMYTTQWNAIYLVVLEPSGAPIGAPMQVGVGYAATLSHHGPLSLHANNTDMLTITYRGAQNNNLAVMSYSVNPVVNAVTNDYEWASVSYPSSLTESTPDACTCGAGCSFDECRKLCNTDCRIDSGCGSGATLPPFDCDDGTENVAAFKQGACSAYMCFVYPTIVDYAFAHDDEPLAPAQLADKDYENSIRYSFAPWTLWQSATSADFDDNDELELFSCWSNKWRSGSSYDFGDSNITSASTTTMALPGLSVDYTFARMLNHDDRYTVQHIAVPNQCGNDSIEADEECDNGVNNTNSANAECRPDCRVRRCGDGITDSDDWEQCDYGHDNDDTRSFLGFGCTTECVRNFNLRVRVVVDDGSVAAVPGAHVVVTDDDGDEYSCTIEDDGDDLCLVKSFNWRNSTFPAPATIDVTADGYAPASVSTTIESDTVLYEVTLTAVSGTVHGSLHFDDGDDTAEVDKREAPTLDLVLLIFDATTGARVLCASNQQCEVSTSSDFEFANLKLANRVYKLQHSDPRFRPLAGVQPDTLTPETGVFKFTIDAAVTDLDPIDVVNRPPEVKIDQFVVRNVDTNEVVDAPFSCEMRVPSDSGLSADCMPTDDLLLRYNSDEPWSIDGTNGRATNVQVPFTCLRCTVGANSQYLPTAFFQVNCVGTERAAACTLLPDHWNFELDSFTVLVRANKAPSIHGTIVPSTEVTEVSIKVPSGADETTLVKYGASVPTSGEADNAFSVDGSMDDFAQVPIAPSNVTVVAVPSTAGCYVETLFELDNPRLEFGAVYKLTEALQLASISADADRNSGSALTVAVRDASTLEAIETATVSIAAMWCDGVEFTATKENTASAAFTGAPIGLASVLVQAEGYADGELDVTLARGETLETTVNLVPLVDGGGAQ